MFRVPNDAPYYECTDDDYERFGGNPCDAMVVGDPSVYDYVSSWNDGQDGFMYLNSEAVRTALGYRVRQAAHVWEEEGDGWRIAGELANVFVAATNSDRDVQDDGLSPILEQDVAVLLSTIEGECEQLSPQEKLDPAPRTITELIEDVTPACDPASLGQFANVVTDWSEARQDKPELFDALNFQALGVVVGTESTSDGPLYDIIILAGEAGNLNYDAGGGYSGPGQQQTWTSFGTDDGVIGTPEPGSVVLWFDRSYDGVIYGWAHNRTPKDVPAAQQALGELRCDVLNDGPEAEG